MIRKLKNLLPLIASCLLVANSTFGVAAAPTVTRATAPAPQYHQPGPGVVMGEEKGASGTATYIVQLQAPALALYRGEIAGLEATNPATRGEVRLDVRTPDSQAYVQYLATEQAAFKATVDSALGHAVTVKAMYRNAFNGMALSLTPAEARVVASLNGVRVVQREWVDYPETDAGPAWIGAPAIWNGSQSPSASKGEGVIVGIFDTGINSDHVSFADIGADGYNHTNPFGAGVYVGYCVTTPAFCNDKLIGAWNYADGPEDNDGHGSHTASTTAGNVVTATMIAPTITFTSTISGVAPHANIIAYDVCTVGCPGAGTLLAMDQAISDTVDVINFSIGSTTPPNPWTDAGEQGWLGVRAAGIFLATSAGNSGPNASTTGKASPWYTAVGASTHNRIFGNTLMNMTGGNTTPPADIVGRGITSGYGPAPIVYAGTVSPTNALCNTPWPAGTFTGQIVVCDRGVNGRVQKGQYVLAGGGGGMVLAEVAPGAGPGAVVQDTHVLPATHITTAEGTTLKAWLATGTGHMATLSGSVLATNNAYGDIMASFSSRGPAGPALDILIPSVNAPGVSVWAAYADPMQFNAISGTSMASPHVAGAAALLVAVHPEWTPAQVQSAMMLTSNPTNVKKEDGVTPAIPFDQGSGRVDLTRAARVGYVLDESIANYQAADPGNGGNPSTLNMAALGESDCVVQCTFTRVISSTMGFSMFYGVSGTSPTSTTMTYSPTSFSLLPGGTQTVVVTVTLAGLPSGQWAFGNLNIGPLTEAPDGIITSGGSFPIMVRGLNSALPTTVYMPTRRNEGSQLVTGLLAGPISALTVRQYGFTRGTLMSYSLNQDPSNSDPFNNLNDGTTVFVTMTVPAGTNRIVAEVPFSEAPDVDLFIGRDANGNGLPSAGEIVCQSAGGSWNEYCNVNAPASGPYWIVVQSYQASGTAPDQVDLAYAVVPNTSAGNMTVTGPAVVPGNTPFDVRVFWNIPSMVAGDHWYGAFDLGTDPGNAGNLGMVPVDLQRFADDVTKTVSVASAMPGQTVTYTISILPNVTPVDLTYILSDTIPTGLTYVAGSVTGGAAVTGNALSYTGVMPVQGQTTQVITYAVTVDACTTNTTLNNAVLHNTDNPGSVEHSVAVGLAIICVPTAVEVSAVAATSGTLVWPLLALALAALGLAFWQVRRRMTA